MPMIRSMYGRSIAIAGTLALLLWIIGLIQFAQHLPKMTPDESIKTDAIVVLTGGSKRISTGVSLLATGVADKLLISGVGAPIRVEDLFSEHRINADVLSAKVTLGSEAEDTPGNAIETAKWAMRENVNSIRLVTASYHMPRSLRELGRAMPNIQIIPHPVFPDQVKPEWWKYPGTATLIAGEYSKYIFTGIRIWIADLIGMTRSPSGVQEYQ